MKMYTLSTKLSKEIQDFTPLTFRFRILVLQILLLAIAILISKNSIAGGATYPGSFKTGDWSSAATWRSAALTGNAVSNTANATVTGTGTSFTTQFTSSDAVYIGNNYIGIVSTVNSNTSITLTANALVTSASAAVSRGRVPTSSETLTINQGHTITVDVDDAECSTLNVGPPGSGTSTLDFETSGNPKLTVTNAVVVGNSGNTNRRGVINFSSNASLECGSLNLGAIAANTNVLNMSNGGLLKVNGTITAFSGFTWTPGTGTVELTANNTLPATILTSFRNLNISSGTTTTGVSFSVAGKLTVDGTLTPGATGHVISGAGTLTGTGTIRTTLVSATALTTQYSISTKTLTNLTVDYAAAGNQSIAATPISSTNYGNLITSGTGTKTLLGAIVVNGDISIGSGNTLTVSGSNHAITLGGDWSRTGTFTQGSSTVTFNGNTQTISGSSTTFNNLVINSSTSTTLGVNTSIAGNLTVSTGILDLATFTANRTAGGGIITVANGATLKIGGTNTFPSNFTTKTLNATSTVDYYGTNQTVAIETYGHLILSNSGTKSLTFATNTLTVSNDLTMSGSATAATGGTGTTALISIGRDLILTGTSSLTCTNGIAGTVTITRDISIGNGTTFSPNSGSAYTFGGNVTIGSTGILTKTLGASGTILITGLLTVNGTYTNTINSDLTFRGGITNAGTFTAGTGTYTFNTNNQALTGTLSIPNVTVSGITLTNNNTLTVGSALSGSGTLLQATSSTLNIGGTSGIATLDASTYINTVNYTAASSQTLNSTNYSNVGISGGGSNVKTLGGSNTISGTLTIAASTVLAYGSSAQTLTLSGSGTNTLANSGTIDMSTSNADHVLQIAASSNSSLGTIIHGTGSTIDYSAVGGGQAVNAFTYNNLKLSNTAGVNTAGGNLVVNGTLTTTSGGTLDMGTSAILSGTLTSVLNNGTIKTSVPTATSATPIPTGKTWGGVVEYASSSAQTVVSATSYNNLVISGASIKTLGADASVISVLTIGTGATLAYGSSAQTITLSGTGTNTLVNSGTIDMSASNATHVLQIAATSIASFGTLTNGTGNTVEYTRTSGGQTISATTYNHLLLDNTSGTNTAGGNLVVNGTLTTTAGGTLDMGSSAILSGTLSTITNNGTIKTAVPTATSATPIPSGKTWGGIVEYSAATAQTVVSATSYNTLNISSAGVKSLTSNTTINDELNLLGGSIDLGTYSIDRATSGGSLTISNGATLKIGGTNTIPSNYATHVIGEASTIEFAGTNQSIITLNSSQSYGNIILSGTGNKSLAANTSVAGNWTRISGASLIHNDYTVTFTGANKSIITAPASSVRNSFGGFGGESFYKLSMNKTNTTDSVRLASNVTIEDEIEFVKGAFDCSIGDITIISNRNKTARVAPITNISDITINYNDTGKFIIHRFLPIDPWSSARRWRLLTAPVSSTSTNDITISRAWQEGTKNTTLSNLSNPQPGYGITITNGNTSGAVANGFDLGNTVSPSIYYLNPGIAPTWVAPTNTTTVKISDREGFMTFVRGHRGIGITNQWAVPDTTTLAPKGKINLGDVSKSIVQGIQILGNPYASAINFNNISYNGVNPGSVLGTGLTYYLWDPRSPGAYNVGQWITFSSNGDGTYAVSPTPTSLFSNTGIIESGSAFVINSDANGTFIFHESDKVNTSSTIGIASRPGGRPTASPIPRVAVNMFLKNTDGSKSMMDGISVLYDDTYRDIVDGQDAKKVSTFTSRERVGVVRDASLLSIERRKTMDIIDLNIIKINTEPHQLEIVTSNLNPATQAFLIDKVLNTETLLTNNGTTFYDFSTTGVEATDLTRFNIVFRSGGVLPILFNQVKATKKSNDILVEWKVENELNITQYKIEKSTDGINFKAVGTVNPNSINSPLFSYAWLDNNTQMGDNYYRIIGYSSTSTSPIYSQIVKIKMGGAFVKTINVYPNPIQNNTVNISFNNQEIGRYKLLLSTISGQVLYSNTLNVNSNSLVENIRINTVLSKGLYNLEIISPNNTRKIEKIIVE